MNDEIKIKKLFSLARVLNHKLRRKIYEVVEEAVYITPTEIYIKLRIEQAVASLQLAIMLKEDLLVTTREGKYIYYSINTRTKAKVELILNLTNMI